MPKNAVVTRDSLRRAPVLDSLGFLPGSIVRPGSLPADRLNVRELSAISARLGNVISGNITIGTEGGARVIIGDTARGIQAYNADGTLFFSVSWQNESMRIGRIGQPGITAAWGNVHVDGDCIVDGTITAGKLQVGKLARVILEEDEIRVGDTNEEGMFTGFRASPTEAGGMYAGTWTWQVDNVTGYIVSNADIGVWPYAGVGLGAGKLWVNSLGMLDGTRGWGGILMTSYEEESPGVVVKSHESEIIGASSYLLLRNIESIRLYRADRASWPADDAADLVRIDTSGISFDGMRWGFRVVSGGYWLYTPEGSPPLMVGVKKGVNTICGLVMDGSNVWVAQSGLVLPWGFTTGQVYKGNIYFDTSTNTVKVWDGSTWRTLAYSA